MPNFNTIEEANDYIQNALKNGMACEQRFNIDGTITVVCRLAAGVPMEQKRAIPVNKEEIKPNLPTQTLFGEEIRPKSEEQAFFPGNVELNLPYELRDYQKEAVAFALANKHAIIEIPTGRGKSLIALAVVNELVRERPRRTLVLVPTTVLMDQWVKDGFKAAGVEASRVYAESHAWGMYTVSTYQSAVRNLEKIPQYDIIIFDEVHHLFSPEYSKILYTVLASPNASEKYLIGLTATAREYGEGKIMQQKYFPAVFSKKLEEFQTGPSRIPVIIERIPVYFTDEERAFYDSYVGTISKANRTLGPVPEWSKYIDDEDEAVRRLALAAIRDYAYMKKLLAETPQKLDAILRILQSTPGQFIIFSDSIEGIKAIENILRMHGISEGSIYSGVPEFERQEIIKGLREGRIRVLVGGNAITEGIDLPDISNVILSSLLVKSSRIPVQRLGRVLRPKEGKQVRIFLIYVTDTIEEDNARRVYDILGERRQL